MVRSGLSMTGLLLLHSIDTSSSTPHDLDDWNDQRMQKIWIARKNTVFPSNAWRPILQCRVDLVFILQENLKSWKSAEDNYFLWLWNKSFNPEWRSLEKYPCIGQAVLSLDSKVNNWGTWRLLYFTDYELTLFCLASPWKFIHFRW